MFVLAFFFLRCVCVLVSLYMGVWMNVSGCSSRPEDDIRSLGAGFSRPLRVTQWLLTTEPSLALSQCFLIMITNEIKSVTNSNRMSLCYKIQKTITEELILYSREELEPHELHFPEKLPGLSFSAASCCLGFCGQGGAGSICSWLAQDSLNQAGLHSGRKMVPLACFFLYVQQHACSSDGCPSVSFFIRHLLHVPYSSHFSGY